MIKKIKKHKNKLFILMLTLISALTLFLNVGKTYAYNTDEFSYTIDNVRIYNTGSFWQYDSTNHIITSNNTINNSGTLLIQLDFNNLTTINKYLLVNLKVETSQDNVNFNNVSSYSVPTMSYLYNYSNMNNSYRIAQGRITYTSINSNNNVYTLILSPNNAYQSNEGNYNNLYFNLNCGVYEAYYKITIVNIDYVSNYEIGLQQYYDTYYGQIEDNYNTLLNNYNDLQDDYTTLEGNYNALQDNYDELETNYNTLQDSYDNLGNVYSSLWNNIPYFTLLNEYYDYSYMSSFSNILQHYNADVFSINDMKENNVVNGSTLNLSNITSLNNTNDIYNLGIFFSASFLRNGIEDNWKYLYPSEEINISVVPPINLNNNNKIVLTFKGLQSTMRVNVIVITYNDLVTNNFMINKDLLLKKDETFDFEFFKYLESMSIIIDKVSLQNASQNFILNATTSNYYQGYSIGFDDGFSSGRSTQEQIDKTAIDGLTSTINAQQSDINDMRNTINLISTSNEQLRNELDDINANNLTWQKMFFTMADTPLKTVASVLGKDSGNAFLGINLYQTFIGLLTTLAIIWLIKRIL